MLRCRRPHKVTLVTILCYDCNRSNKRPGMSGKGDGAMRRFRQHRLGWWIWRHLRFPPLQLPPKTLTPSQNASKSVQIADRSASQQNMYEEDDLRLPPSTGSIIVATAVPVVC